MLRIVIAPASRSALDAGAAAARYHTPMFVMVSPKRCSVARRDVDDRLLAIVAAIRGADPDIVLPSATG
jgi:hypothetical protein